ncbi:AraC family transcriptional regulator [Cohnella sp. WQ 127256]|uniref:helix-turn-helix domain-containing protein n=1 Tax=Cohnella sp. WQ 127256 TaxID=2938790 RepID=UPI002118AA8E|nr:AraC family transcriptional regulator [Cohnella sp. WQ 127256]
MLPFRLVEMSNFHHSLPLYAYSVGRHNQYYHSRPDGFPAYQIFIIHKGQGLFRDLENGEEYTLSEGDAFAFPPDRPHEYYPLSHEPWQIGFIGFIGTLAAPLLEQVGLLPSFPQRPDSLEQSWNDLGEIWHDSTEPSQQRLFEISVKLYQFVLRLRVDNSSPDSSLHLRADEVRNHTLQQALLLMNQHYTEPLLISNLASAVGYSSQHFQRLFLQQFSITPHRYLQNLRMERALQLLKENASLQIQEIARQVGMETNYFVRSFRQTYGQTPGVWREKGKKKSLTAP